MRKISIYLIFVALWILASVAVVTFPGLMVPVSGALGFSLDETIALFLIVMVILTMIALALIGREAGRSVAEFLGE
ncbi:hypothetical protein [Methanoculleus sp. 7T]|jgi:hypothetical protein|uniref:hypothetical protein n=1 Tax=Methanoculleus sp. 7T TaxID=2937282 RepID=UPI0020C15764|nr:hypothetical protein [Methanoculleus sp. 7T]MCK8519436.1 hypothetical protein [Methanoculleus sp. 7T]